MMRRHVGHLFEGWLDGCHDGRIELAWTDARDGRLRHAAIFGTDELDELVERAATENRKPGQNVYVGQALRKPDIAPFGRCKDDEFFALTAFYTDIDDDVVLAAARQVPQSAAACRPPWSSPGDIRICARRCSGGSRRRCAMQISAAGRTLRSPRRSAATPPSSIPAACLRLGGSIAWPRKEGRIIERTELQGVRRWEAQGLRARADRQGVSAGGDRRWRRVDLDECHGGRTSRRSFSIDCTGGIAAARCRSARPICRSRPASPASAPATTGTTTSSVSPATGSRAAGPMPRFSPRPRR